MPPASPWDYPSARADDTESASSLPGFGSSPHRGPAHPTPVLDCAALSRTTWPLGPPQRHHPAGAAQVSCLLAHASCPATAPADLPARALLAMSQTPAASGPAPLRLWPLWLVWTVFVVYGSLVPLNFHPLPWPDALRLLMQAPMLSLGVAQRADWVANGVLYFPVGFLGAGVLMGSHPGAGRKLLASGAALGLGLALAVAVELAQTAFPGRTVSLNDLLAETLGSALGAVAAWAGTRPFRALLAALQAGGRGLWPILAPAYVLAYLALALFPFDLLLSPAELSSKLHSPYVAWWMVGLDGAAGPWRQLAKLCAEVLAALPVGLYWAFLRAGRSSRPGRPPARLGSAFMAGLGLGLAIEGAQLLLASGVCQGVSVLTRALGCTAGAALMGWQALPHAETVRAAIRRVSLPALAAYVSLLALNAGWPLAPWLPLPQVWQRLQDDVRFIPLYYHYFSSESHALVSLLVVAASYAPLGLLGWAWHLQPGVAAACAALLAGANEAGRLMVAETRPDPSNLLIAAAAAWALHRLALIATPGTPLAHAPARPLQRRLP